MNHVSASPTDGNLKIAHLNINSLLNKLDEVKNMLTYLTSFLFLRQKSIVQPQTFFSDNRDIVLFDEIVRKELAA